MLHKLKTIVLLSLFAFIQACSQPTFNGDFKEHINNAADFNVLKGAPLSQNYANIECVKLVYEIRSDKLYYVQSKKYRWHYDFISRVLGCTDDLTTFNQRNYTPGPDRTYILATLNYNTSTRHYFLQFAPPDQLNKELIRKIYAKLNYTFEPEKHIKVLINTTSLQLLKTELKTEFPVINSDELFKNQTYQSICNGQAQGELLFIHADSIKPGTNYKNNILVLEGNSNNLPLCAGVICNTYQTPLSHIALLTQNRRTPCAFQKAAHQNSDFKNLQHQWVKLTVSENSLHLNPVKKNDKTHAPKPVLHLKWDSIYQQVTPIMSVSLKETGRYGAKVCNLSELYRFRKKEAVFDLPQHAHAIPIACYIEHLKKANVWTRIQNLNTLPDSLIHKQLKTIRKAIKQTPVSPRLLTELQQKLHLSHPEIKKWRFRSSSNAEDLDQFNGAGLYDSESGSFTDPSHTVESAIQKVWASLWSNRAYNERRFFNMNDQHAGMGILVHPAIDNEAVNGVAITKNLYRKGYVTGFVINLQKGEESVVSPKNDVIAEQFVTYIDKEYDLYLNANAIDWISMSSLNAGKSLLTLDEIKQLSLLLKQIKSRFYTKQNRFPKTAFNDFALDIEFKILTDTNGKRRLYIKQVRPFYGQ